MTVTDRYNRSERAVGPRGSSPAASASILLSWQGASNRHSSARPPAPSEPGIPLFHQAARDGRSVRRRGRARRPRGPRAARPADARGRPSGGSLTVYAARTPVRAVRWRSASSLSHIRLRDIVAWIARPCSWNRRKSTSLPSIAHGLRSNPRTRALPGRVAQAAPAAPVPQPNRLRLASPACADNALTISRVTRSAAARRRARTPRACRATPARRLPRASSGARRSTTKGAQRAGDLAQRQVRQVAALELGQPGGRQFIHGERQKTPLRLTMSV